MTSSLLRCRPHLLRLAGREALCFGALVLACVAPAGAGEVRVQVSGSLVDLDAAAAPLPEILDRLARPTGMKVVFDGVPPRPLVTISVHGRSPTQTVLAVFEGLGVNYALLSDASGVRVQTLLVSGTAAPSSRSSSPTPRANRNAPLAPPADDLPEDEMPPSEEGPGVEPEMTSPVPPGALAETPPENAGNPGPTMPQPQPTYTPGPLLPPAPATVMPFRPFPAPTPTAPPQAGQLPEAPPPSP
jgi:hypothetical protein